jgi:AsmA protein
MKRKILLIGAAVVVVLLIAVVALPFLIDANQFRPKLEAEMTSALGRKVQVGNISLSILSGAVSVDDVAIADDPAYSAGPFLKAKAVNVGVALMPLIFSRSLQLQSFSVEQPEVFLLRSPSGKWNFSSLGAASKSKGGESAGGSSPSNTDVSVGKLAITNGRMSVGTVGSRAKARVYEDVSLEATNISYTSQFPFKFSAKTPGNGTLKVDGKAGPLNQTDAAETPLEAKVEIQHLDLASTGFLDPASGIAGMVDLTSDVKSNGREATAQGKVKADKLQLVQKSSPARVPVEVTYDSDYDLKRQTGAIKRGDVQIGKALAHLTGTFNDSGATTTVQMKLAAQNAPVQDLEAVLPALGVTLPSGASLQSGTMNANLTISGPVDRLVTNGPIDLSNAKLHGFDMGSKLGALSTFAGLPSGSDTLIQTLSSVMRVAPDGIRADSLNLIVAGIGNLTGNGTIAPGGALDFKMLAKLSNSGALGEVQRIASLGHPQGGVPFSIKGTTSNPVFEPDLSRAVGGLVPKNPTTQGGAADLIQGLLGGKKKKPQ